MFCPDCGSYVNDLSKICTICNCKVDIASAKKKTSKISLIKSLNRSEITEQKNKKKCKHTKRPKNQNKSKSKSNSKRQKTKAKANKKSKSKNKSKKNKKLKMPKKIKGATGRIEYNNGYAIIEGMSASGGRMKKGSFKKRRNGEHGGFVFYS